ncbi:MAG: hypothetical protein EVA26_01355 [Burkholderiaceae bacterium]|nr:MAG: hypothetical protein EVA26_01355 [Burkholderiaceae bacterium]
MSQHWILKKENIKKLWVCSIVLLVSLVLVQLIFPIKGHFEVESWIGFGAWFGFIACVLMILFSKLLALVVKKPEDYYEKNEGNS